MRSAKKNETAPIKAISPETKELVFNSKEHYEAI